MTRSRVSAHGQPERLAMTHFGAYEDVDAQLDELECPA